jgi:hypothetical protein
MPKGAHTEPGRATAIEGEVVQDGPDGVGLSMTPDAAAETGKRLQRAAKEARRQTTTMAEPTRLSRLR